MGVVGGSVCEPAQLPGALPDAVLQQLEALMTRRLQLLDMVTAERHRLEHAAAPIRREIARHVRWPERRIGATDRDLDDIVLADVGAMVEAQKARRK